MPEPDDLLIQWRQTPEQLIQPSSIRTTEALQPRAMRLAPIKDHARLESDSRGHVSLLTGLLAVNPTVELEPVLVAKIGNKLLLVDGHHRRRAYLSAGRQLIPARILSTDMATAVLVSKLVNLDGIKLAMHQQQRLEAAWQYLAHVTGQGSQWPLVGITCKAVGARFAISHDTVSRMARIMQSGKVKDFSEAACDPGTGWPQWRHVRGNAIRDRFSDVDGDARAQRDAMSLAKTLAKHLGKYPSETHRRAIDILKADKALHLDPDMLDGLTESISDEADADEHPKLEA